jgi:hypothetical protein
MARAAPVPHSKLTPLEQRIQALCERERVEASALGIAVGFSTDTVNQWLRKIREGSLPGRLEQWVQLARHYKVSLDWLLDPTPLPAGYELGKDNFGETDIADEVVHLPESLPVWVRATLHLISKYPGQAQEIVPAVALAAELDPEEPADIREALAIIKLRAVQIRQGAAEEARDNARRRRAAASFLLDEKPPPNSSRSRAATGTNGGSDSGGGNEPAKTLPDAVASTFPSRGHKRVKRTDPPDG